MTVLTAPPDLAETALLVEWETQWRQTALNNAEAARSNDAVQGRRVQMKTLQNRQPSWDEATRDSAGSGGTSHTQPANTPSVYHPVCAVWLLQPLAPLIVLPSYTRSMPSVSMAGLRCLTVCSFVDLCAEVELDRLLTAAEWVDGSYHSGAMSRSFTATARPWHSLLR